MCGTDAFISSIFAEAPYLTCQAHTEPPHIDRKGTDLFLNEVLTVCAELTQ